MKALFFSLPVHGHTNPTLPLVRELVARGEQVLYYSTPAFGEKIEATGAEYRAYRKASLTDLKTLPEMEQFAWLLMGATAELLRDQLPEWRGEAPDYVIADSVAPWGTWLANLLGVPRVTSIATLAINRQVMMYGVKHGVRPKSAGRFLSKLRYMLKASRLRRQLSRQYEVRGPGIVDSVMGSSGLNISYTSRHFQPCEEAFDESFLFIGPSVEARSETVPFPWEHLRHPTVVYISLGTLFNADAAFYRNCYQAFGDQDFQVILSAGSNVSAAECGPAPPNFIVQTHVPQLEVLQRAAAFVTHGGLNSVSEGLMYGVPLLAIPQMGEQRINAKRVEELGAGLFLSQTQVTPERLREAVRGLLAEPRFRDRADAVRQSFLSAGGVARAADAVLAFTRRPA